MVRGRRRSTSGRRRSTNGQKVTDRLTRNQRSELMARVRSTHTAPEIKVRSLSHRLGYRFSLHRKDLPGSPDVVFPRLRSVIFVHGCFWHCHSHCRKASIPATRRDFWTAKLDRNVARDAIACRQLRREGWRVLVIWECETKTDGKLLRKLNSFLAKGNRHVSGAGRSRPGTSRYRSSSRSNSRLSVPRRRR